MSVNKNDVISLIFGLTSNNGGGGGGNSFGSLTGSPYDNTSLATALNGKASNQFASETQNGIISSYIYNFLIWQPASVIVADQTIDEDGTVTQGGNLTTNFGTPNSYVLETYNFKVRIRLNYVDNMVLFLPNIPATTIANIANFSEFYTKNEIEVTNHPSSNRDAKILTLGTKNNAGVEEVDILGQGNTIITNGGGGIVLEPNDTTIFRWSDSRQRWEVQ